MAEVFRVFDDPVALNNVAYTAQVCGRPSGHLWEGWIEFVSADGDEVLRSSRETTQPNREALEYWAGGLSTTYLEGALVRALAPARSPAGPTPSHPFFDAPARPVANEPTVDRAILDPFSVGAKGETLLRSELGALDPWHLRNIVRAYDFVESGRELEGLTRLQLIEIIVRAVQPG